MEKTFNVMLPDGYYEGTIVGISIEEAKHNQERVIKFEIDLHGLRNNVKVFTSVTKTHKEIRRLARLLDWYPGIVINDLKQLLKVPVDLEYKYNDGFAYFKILRFHIKEKKPFSSGSYNVKVSRVKEKDKHLHITLSLTGPSLKDKIHVNYPLPIFSCAGDSAYKEWRIKNADKTSFSVQEAFEAGFNAANRRNK